MSVRRVLPAFVLALLVLVVSACGAEPATEGSSETALDTNVSTMESLSQNETTAETVRERRAGRAADLALISAAGRGDARAVEMARESAEYRELGGGEGLRHRARFYPEAAIKLRDLFEIVGQFDSTDVLIDDKPIPYARELWLPLVWMLIR